MSRPRTPLLALTGVLALAALARAGQLTLAFDRTLDLSALPADSIGDLAFELGAGKLWLCDGSANGLVYQLNPTTGAQISQFSPASIPGLNLGADALSMPRTGASPDLFLFSSFSESEAGRVSQTGTLVADFATAHGATGSDFDAAGNFWIASGTTAGGGSSLRRLTTTTGATLSVIPILGTTQRVVDLAFDPHTGACYCLLENYQLLEVNTSTGAQLTSVDLTPFLTGTNGIAGGLAFGGHGLELYVGVTNAAGSQLVVLQREYTATVCDGDDPFLPCPCGNIGLPDHGCDNSFGTGGAHLRATGVPSVQFDSFTLHVAGLPPTAPCLFFQGTATFESVPLVQGDGLICITGQVVRLATKIPSNGVAHFPTGADPDLSVRGQIPVSGGTRYYQVWYRNAASFCTTGTFNFSNAVQMLWAP